MERGGEGGGGGGRIAEAPWRGGTMAVYTMAARDNLLGSAERRGLGAAVPRGSDTMRVCVGHRACHDCSALRGPVCSRECGRPRSGQGLERSSRRRSGTGAHPLHVRPGDAGPYKYRYIMTIIMIASAAWVVCRRSAMLRRRLSATLGVTWAQQGSRLSRDFGARAAGLAGLSLAAARIGRCSAQLVAKRASSFRASGI